MELIDQSQPARHIKNGRETIEISFGKILKIETTPGGAEILSASVPEGKKWTVHLNIDIIETTA